MEKQNPDLFFLELSPIENNMLSNQYKVDDDEEILIITIDIGDGRKDEIRAYEHDDSDQLALDFCFKHSLGVRAKMLLTDEIEKYLKIALSRLRAKECSSQARREFASQSPSRPRRNQTFTQKSMQVKNNLVNKKEIIPQSKPSSAMLPKKFSSVQESSDSTRLKNQRSLSKNIKTASTSLFDQVPDSTKKNIKENSKRSPKRCNSLYAKPEISKINPSEK